MISDDMVMVQYEQRMASGLAAHSRVSFDL